MALTSPRHYGTKGLVCIFLNKDFLKDYETASSLARGDVATRQRGSTKTPLTLKFHALTFFSKNPTEVVNCAYEYHIKVDRKSRFKHRVREV